MEVKIINDKYEYIPELEPYILQDVWEYCAITDFFEKERKAGRNTTVAMIACNCSRCSPRML